ncbi:hypothetical protein EDC31_1734 [Acidomonas methanolica]|nr:hypothetical protein EDC31_1734 [Acidomonas methanolica]
MIAHQRYRLSPQGSRQLTAKLWRINQTARVVEPRDWQAEISRLIGNRLKFYIQSGKSGRVEWMCMPNNINIRTFTQNFGVDRPFFMDTSLSR